VKLNYEKNQLIISIIVIFLIIEIYIVFLSVTTKINTYIEITGVMVSDEIVQILVDDKQLKTILISNYIYIENHKKKKEVQNITKHVLKRNKKSYHYIKLKLNINKKYKTNDPISITIYNKKEKIISIFKTCWKEDV